MNDSLTVVHKAPQAQSEPYHHLHEEIKTVAEFISEPLLTIPIYQRPYKWDKSNLASLFNDIKTQCNKPAYRLGSIVLHYSKEYKNASSEADESLNDASKPVKLLQDDIKYVEKLNIVDGQQRTLTLMLTVLAIAEYYKDKTSDEAIKVKEYLDELPEKVTIFSRNQKFASEISQYNLHQNYQEITRIIRRGELTPSHIKFLLQQCQVVVFVLNDESEAFQFFDSQNSRGKDLYPHDLLKAFHLREFDTDDQTLKAKTVAYWEKLGDDKLAKLFSEHLFRIKHWSQSKQARYFTKHQIDVFKGINLDKANIPPYAQSLLIAHQYIKNYNASTQRYIDKQIMPYPFQLDQTIINGQRFFEMVQHYHTLIDQITQVSIHDATQSNIKDSFCSAIDDSSSCCTVSLYNQTLNQRASVIIHMLNTYDNRHRQGDKYTRNLFDNTLIYYIDKFGIQDLSQAIETIFIWAYQIRLKKYAVKLATMDTHATDEIMFRRIKEATLSDYVLTTSIPSLKYNEIDKNNRPENEIGKKNCPEKDDDKIAGYELYRLFEYLNYVIKEV